MYNLVQYGYYYSKKSGDLWQYHRDESATDAGVMVLLMIFLVIVLCLNLNKK